MHTTVTCVQAEPVDGDVEANLEGISQAVERARADGADLVAFPECATTGYLLGEATLEVAEAVTGPTVTKLREISATYCVQLAVGIIERAGDAVFDSLVLLDRGELVTTYRKTHLFAAEREVYTRGNAPTVVDTRLGRIALTICYDMLFPDYIRSLVDRGAELVLNVTNWITDPWQRSQGWEGAATQALARTRALENGVHVATAAACGRSSIGYSSIVSPSGAILASCAAEPARVTATITDPSAALEQWRTIATYRADRRPELYATDVTTGTVAR